MRRGNPLMAKSFHRCATSWNYKRYSDSWIVYLIVATSCCWNLFRSSCKVSSVRSSRCFNCKVSKQPGTKQISEVSTTFIPNPVWFSLVGGFRQLGSFPLEFTNFFVICWEHSLRKNTDKTDLLTFTPKNWTSILIPANCHGYHRRYLFQTCDFCWVTFHVDVRNPRNPRISHAFKTPEFCANSVLSRIASSNKGTCCHCRAVLKHHPDALCMEYLWKI